MQEWFSTPQQNRVDAVPVNGKEILCAVCVFRVTLEEWVGWLLTLCDQDKNDSNSLTLPATSKPNLLSRCKVETKFGHKDFEYRNNKSPGFLAIVTSENGAIFDGCHGSYKAVFYTEALKSRMTKKLVVEQILIPPDSVFISYGFLQHEGAAWEWPT